MSDTPLVVEPRGRDVVGVTPAFVVALFTLGAFGVLGGAGGVALAFVPIVALVAGGPLVAFIIGTVTVLGAGDFLAGGPLAAHLVLTSYLVAGVYTEHGRRMGVLSLAVVASYAALFVVGLSSTDGLTETTAVLVVAAAGVGYMIHRYELVVLGLADE